MTLIQPDITFVYALTQPFMAPVPKEEVDRLGADFADTPVGNGPFKVGTYDSQGQRYVFTRFDDYYWKGLPYLDEVEFRWGIDQSVQLLMMQRGELDLMGYGLERPEPRRDARVRPAQEVPLRAAAARLAVDQHAPARRGRSATCASARRSTGRPTATSSSA